MNFLLSVAKQGSDIVIAHSSVLRPISNGISVTQIIACMAINHQMN